MPVKTLNGPDARVALYALASVTGEVVLALAADRDEVKSRAAEGATRAGRDPVAVVLIRDPGAFLAGLGRLSWKRIPVQIFIDGGQVDLETVDAIGSALESVAPVVLAGGARDEGGRGSQLDPQDAFRRDAWTAFGISSAANQPAGRGTRRIVGATACTSRSCLSRAAVRPADRT